MSTRGLWGFVVGGVEKLTYNHYDSYPGGLGCDILSWLNEVSPQEGVTTAMNIEIDNDVESNLISEVLYSGKMADFKSFAADSLFCEWGYVINMDKALLEVYKGFQQEPHNEGRFARMEPRHNGYYPIKLVAEWDLDDLPSFTNFCSALEGQVEEEDSFY